MLFNSYIFIFVFLPVTLIVFFGLTKFHSPFLAKVWLTLSSVFFYAYWNASYLPILLVSILFNYQMGRYIGRETVGSKKSKLLFWIGICFNLSLLGYYKYANFFISSFLPASVTAFLNSNFGFNKISLPLAISFFTFLQIAYLVDAYRGENKKYTFLDYSLFVTFFPHLIAGPLVHHKDLISQFQKLRNFVFSQKNMALGLTLFTLGLAKKVLIADNISPWVASAFSHAASVNFIEAWVGALSYTFQLYFDFSGYSDMAIGLSLMFNIRLPINFDSPYKSTSIVDFWRRWHITLSNFLRDYLYIPLGGSRRGEFRRYTNLFVTMLLGGLWHGANWTFVIWGGLHGLFLSVNHWWKKTGLPMPKLLAWSLTFLALVFTWVLFRAHNLQDASEMLQAMLGMKGVVLPGEPQGKLAVLSHFGVQLQPWKELNYIPEVNGNKALSLGVLAGLTLWVAFLPNTQQILAKFRPTWWWAVWIGATASFCLLSLNRVSEFLYFQF